MALQFTYNPIDTNSHEGNSIAVVAIVRYWGKQLRWVCDESKLVPAKRGIVQIEVSFFETRVTKEFYLSTTAKLTKRAKVHGGEYDGWFGYVSDDWVVELMQWCQNTGVDWG